MNAIRKAEDLLLEALCTVIHPMNGSYEHEKYLLKQLTKVVLGRCLQRELTHHLSDQMNDSGAEAAATAATAALRRLL